MHIYLTGHNGLGNRGCEALLRSTVAMIRQWQPRATFSVPSVRPMADRAQWPEAVSEGVEFVPTPCESRALQYWGYACRHWSGLTQLPWPDIKRDDSLEAELDKADLVLSIGGDNYTLDYDFASLASFVGVAQAAMGRGVPVVLWGASVGPFDRIVGVERHMRKHLAQMAAITVRESISFNYLNQLGLYADTSAQQRIHAVTDSAFTLSTQAVAEEQWRPLGRFSRLLGFNLSPLIHPTSSTILRNPRAALVAHAADFIRRAISRWGCSVVLVPHVSAANSQATLPFAISSGQDDAVLLAEVAQAVGNHPQLALMPASWNAAQIKDVVSQCDFFIGARTHSTIAALSQGVPTVAISYSAKARGIHRDLFGNEDGIIPSHQVTAPSLERALVWLMTHEEALRRQLAEVVPVWRQRAWHGIQVLKKIAPAS
jgi:colanic acid/amylovoran biosynthesis protein